MPAFYDLRVNLSAAQIDYALRAIESYGCPSVLGPGGLDDLVNGLVDAAGAAGLAPDLDGTLVPMADLCPGCGRNTAVYGYAPAPDCFDQRMGACGYWRNDRAAYAAIAAHAGAAIPVYGPAVDAAPPAFG